MSKNEKTVLNILIVIALIMAGGLARLFIVRWNQPLGPLLQPILGFGLQPTSQPVNPLLYTPRPDQLTSVPNSAEATSQTINACGAQSPMFLLLIGSDTRADGYLYGLADVIRIARIDFNKPEVVLLEFPRDLWVEIPDIADNLNGQDHEKLNQAYLYGNKGFGYTDDPAGGPGLLARTLTLNFGTQIDHYTAINMRTFEDIVNAVGGIDVTLPKTVDGRTAEDNGSHLLFLEGTHHLTGEQALTLARVRISGVFARADNQTRVICALRDKLTSPSVIPDIPKLIQSFQNSVQTSLSPEQISQLTCLGNQIAPNQIIMTSFPQELFEQDRIYDPQFEKEVFAWKVNYDELRKYTEQFNQGTWPSPVTAVGSSHPPAPSASTESQPQPEVLFCD